MRNKLFIAAVVFLCFPIILFGTRNVAQGQASSQDVNRELEEFQTSLQNWMNNFDTLSDQFSSLKKSVNGHLAPLKDLGNIGDKLSSLDSRVKKVEQSTSIEEVKKVIDSFGKTFDTFKKLFADLKKKVEDQGVKISVLEKKYLQAERPLKPFKKEVEDIKTFVKETFAEQEKMINASIEKISKRVGSQGSMLLNNIANIKNRLKKLEGGGVVGTSPPHGAEVASEAPLQEAPVPEHPPQAPSHETQEEAKVAEETSAHSKESTGEEQKAANTEEAKKNELFAALEKEGFEKIGENFFVRNVKLDTFGSSTQIEGEIKNVSGRDQSIAEFEIRIYDLNDVLMEKIDFSIKSFKEKETRTFSQIITGYNPVSIGRYEITAKVG